MYEAKCLVMDYHNHATQQQPAPHQLHQFHQLHPLAPDTSSRWSQYQQLWRQHQMFINGKSGARNPCPRKPSKAAVNILKSLNAVLDRFYVDGLVVKITPIL